MTRGPGSGTPLADGGRPSPAKTGRGVHLPAGSADLAACAAVHVAGQAANLLFQIMLARGFGMVAYGEIGLAHLLFGLIGFVGDLGYSSLFLRENPATPGWSRLWRTALGHKFVAVLALYSAALIGWVLAGGAGDGLSYLLAASPAALFAIAVPWPPLLAGGRRLAAFCLQQAAWPAALAFWLAFAGNAPSAAAAGAAVTAGFAVQFALSLAVWKQARDWLPLFAWRGGLLRSAVSLSAIGIAGAAHDRLTPFLLARLAPDFLPVLLLVGHGLNGLSGIAVQINRLLLPRITSAAGLRWSLGLAAAASLGTALLLQAVLLAGLVAPVGLAALHPSLLLPTLLTWGVATTSGFAAVEMIGQRREGQLARIVLLGVATSAALQSAAAFGGISEGVVWARAFCLVAVAGACMRACGIAPRLPGLVLGGATLSATLVPHGPWLWPLSGILLVVAAALIATGRDILGRRSQVPS